MTGHMQAFPGPSPRHPDLDQGRIRSSWLSHLCGVSPGFAAEIRGGRRDRSLAGCHGMVMIGKTHSVQFAFGALGVNRHHGTVRNPWDAEGHRVCGGSSTGAGVAVAEGSCILALGSDAGGSIRVPAAFTGTVGLKTTFGRWPCDGALPLRSTSISPRSRVSTLLSSTRSLRLRRLLRGTRSCRCGSGTPSLARLAEVCVGTISGARNASGMVVATWRLLQFSRRAS